MLYLHDRCIIDLKFIQYWDQRALCNIMDYIDGEWQVGYVQMYGAWLLLDTMLMWKETHLEYGSDFLLQVLSYARTAIVIFGYTRIPCVIYTWIEILICED